jgi:diaminopimelate decarboxylase
MYSSLMCDVIGAGHPIAIIRDEKCSDTASCIVVGHCCESGDLLTCSPGDSETLQPRLISSPRIGDLLSIECCGAYCSSMSAKNYNSFPEAPEVYLDSNHIPHLIRRSCLLFVYYIHYS